MADETDKLAGIHERALRRFDLAAIPQQNIRAHSLECRRFISVPGAMWEGPWGEQFENSIKPEVDKISRGVEKVVTDYRANRIVPDFRPAGKGADPETANTLDGIHRADDYHFKAQQARDNAFEEAVTGGFGAYRLINDLADPYDKDSDEQRINPGMIIVDADQRVFFDPNSKLYDKSDAQWAFVLTAEVKASFEEEWPDMLAEWPEHRVEVAYDWFQPDIVIKAEYYEVEEENAKLYILKHRLTAEEERWWAEDTDDEELEERRTMGWLVDEDKRKRRRVRKYVMTGAEILEDCGTIAGDQIPVVPVYGKRYFVENVERWRGLVSKRMDAQRIYNSKIGKLAETDSLSPREKPIFLSEQMPPHLANLWSEQEQQRHPYALVDPVINPNTGEIVAMGPIGKIEPPQVGPVTATLLQIANGDLLEETNDGADEVIANTSAEAMDIAATRVDSKSGIFLDNMRQSVQREGEIYLSMAKDVYYEPGREVETMTQDGDDGTAKLVEKYTDASGTMRVRNDFTTGRYKVISDVTEATATRRDKTVKSALRTAEVALQAQDMELAQAAILTAIENQDGEGMDELKSFARRKGLSIGLFEPNEDEQAEMEQAAQNQQPDPMAQVAAAQAKELETSAAENMAKTEKIASDIELNRAKTIDTLAEAAKTAKDAEREDLAPPTDGGM